MTDDGTPKTCPVFRPDHNGECLNCDDWIDEHSPEAIEAGRRPVVSLTGDIRFECPTCGWHVTLTAEGAALWTQNGTITPTCQQDQIALVRTEA